MKLQLIAAAALAAAATLPAHALLVTDASAIAGPTTVVDFEAFDGLLTSGPEPVGPGVVFSGDTGAELGATVRDLGDNGLWGANGYFAAVPPSPAEQVPSWNRFPPRRRRACWRGRWA